MKLFSSLGRNLIIHLHNNKNANNIGVALGEATTTTNNDDNQLQCNVREWNGSRSDINWLLLLILP